MASKCYCPSVDVAYSSGVDVSQPDVSQRDVVVCAVGGKPAHRVQLEPVHVRPVCRLGRPVVALLEEHVDV